MTILRVPFEQSAELAKEMEFFSETNEGQKIFERFGSSHALLKHVDTSFEYADLAQAVSIFPKGRVLDVGVGYGLTSAYLALKGFDVTCVEPSLKQCEDMEKNFARLGIKALIANATGESLDKIAGPFDGVLFYSSLHHCDDMPLALKNAHGLLKPGGTIVLFEPVLKFYRTKEWFHKEMLEHPENVGHYGGNEHIYRTGEYTDALASAGFKNIKLRPSATYSATPKQAPWDSAARYAVKKTYFWAVRSIFLKVPLLPTALNRLSLINPLISAQKG